jgi:hypothetical protein
MSDILGTLCSRPLTTDERNQLLKSNKIVGIYNRALVIFVEATKEYWAVLENKQIQLDKSDLSKLGIKLKASK